MTTNDTALAARSRDKTDIVVIVALTENDLTMIRAFTAWDQDSPKCSTKKKYIERGYGKHTFPRYAGGLNVSGSFRHSIDTTGPRTFARLVTLGVIKHCSNGHCWLTETGKTIAAQLQLRAGSAKP